MRQIQLSKGYKVLIDDEDYEYFNQFKWYAKSGRQTIYARRDKKINNKKQNIWMHREILKLKNDNLRIDHIDGNGLNNQKSNLRICTVKQNAQNVNRHIDNKSGYKGVAFVNNKQCVRQKPWLAQLTADGKKVLHSYYKTREEAALAYNAAAIKYFGEFAKLNHVKKPEQKS